MKEKIDMMFRKTFDRSLNKDILIGQIQELYDNVVLYITENEMNEKKIKNLISYAQVLFARTLLRHVTLDDYIAYIDNQEKINDEDLKIKQKTTHNG